MTECDYLHDNKPIHAKALERNSCGRCRENGAKTLFCNSLCEIRKCAVAKSLETCGECAEKESCPKVSAVWQHNPQAKTNLESD